MADFCSQCALELFPSKGDDFEGLSTAKHTESGMYAVVLCEGCGPCQVDHTGSCVSSDCLKEHAN